MKTVVVKSWNALGTTGKILLCTFLFFVVCKLTKR